MQGLRVVTPTNPGDKVGLGGGSGNFVQVISAQGLLTFYDNKSEYFYGYAGWQGVVKDFASLKVSSSVANDVIVANVGKIVVGKAGNVQEFAQISKVSPALNPVEVLNDFTGSFVNFQGDGRNLFAHPGEIVASGSFPQGQDVIIQLAGTPLDGIQYLLLSADGTITNGDSGTIQIGLKSGNTVNAYLKTVPGNAAVATWGITNPNVKINTQGAEAILIPKGTLVGTGGNFNVNYRAGFFAPLMTF